MKKPSASVSLESNGGAIVGATHAHGQMALVNGGDNASYAQAGRNSCALDSHGLYLKPATAHQLGKVEQLPATKQNWAEYERLRLLAWRLRKNAGFAWWVPVLVALALCLLFILWLASQVGRSESYLYPHHYWRVVQNLSPCQSDGSCGNLYLIQEVNDGVANPPTIVDFRDPQHFEAGQTFSHMQGRWIGSAFSVERWDLVRQDRPPVFVNGKFRKLPTLAPNCDFDWSTPEGHVVCEGGKARF